MPLPRYVEMDAWPIATTKCQVCGEMMIYYVYTDKEQTVKRHKPKCHSGTCTEVYENRKG